MLYSKLLVFLLFSITLYANSLAVIVSKETNLNNISKKELSKIFLAKTRRLPNGEKAVASELINSVYQKRFYKLVCNKNEKQLKKYWAKMIFTGRGQPPKKFKSKNELIKFIKNNKNVIAYLPSKDVKDEVKIIMEIKDVL